MGLLIGTLSFPGLSAAVAQAKVPSWSAPHAGTATNARANGQNARLLAAFAGETGSAQTGDGQAQPLPEEGARLVIRTVPEGAAITIDGSPVGMSEVEYGVAEGEHVVEATRKGYMTARRTVQVMARERQVLSLFLIEDRTSESSVGAAKWVAAAGGAGTLIAGVVLLAMGNSERTEAGMRLPDRNNNTTIGAVLLGTGAALSALAGYLFYRDAQRSDSQEDTSQHAVPASAAQKGTVAP